MNPPVSLLEEKIGESEMKREESTPTIPIPRPKERTIVDVSSQCRGGGNGHAPTDTGEKALNSKHYNKLAHVNGGGGFHSDQYQDREAYRDYQNLVKTHVLRRAMCLMDRKLTKLQVLEIGAGKAGDVNKYLKCLNELNRNRKGPKVSMHWCLSDPGYAQEDSSLLSEAQRRVNDRVDRLPPSSKHQLSTEYIKAGMQEVLALCAREERSFTNVSAMFVLNYVLSSAEVARRYLSHIYDLLQPGGVFTLCITDSETICGWEQGGQHPKVDIAGNPEEKWESTYTPTIEGKHSGVRGLLEYVIPQKAFVAVATECGFNVVLNKNHTELEYVMDWGYVWKNNVDYQMHIPRLYRAMVLQRPMQREGKRPSDGSNRSRRDEKKRG